MGKESKLRNPKPEESRYNYSNGTRKLYDRDKMPEGLDSDIWSLAVYFDELAEKDGYTTPGRHIIYTELFSRISKDEDLSKILSQVLDTPQEDVVDARARVTTGICGIEYTGTTEELCILLLQKMIYNYWNISNDFDYSHSINNFCNTVVFSYLKTYTVDTYKRELLLKTGVRSPQPEREIKPSRRTEEEKEIAAIKTRNYTEEELADKMRDFKDRRNK
jgi:hypothetical protein